VDRGAVPRASTIPTKGRHDMSAATEILLEDIKNTSEALSTAQNAGDTAEVNRLTNVLKELKARFTKANEVLNENRSVLKG